MTSYFFYFKKVVFLTTYSLAFLALFYYTSIGVIITFFFSFIAFFSYYFIYSSKHVIIKFQGSLVQGQDPYSLNQKVSKISKVLQIKPPTVYLSTVNYSLLATYFVSKNNSQIFISDKLLNKFNSQILESYLFLNLSQIKTKNSLKNSIAYLITNIFLLFSSKLDFFFSWIFGIHTDPKYVYRSPFSNITAILVYCLNFIFLTQKQTNKSDQLASLHHNPDNITKALWNLQYLSLNTKYPFSFSSSILCTLNPLENKYWLKFLHYQDNAKNRIISISNNYPVF